jgi:hypothetical protein
MCGAKTNFYIVGYNDNVKQGDCAAESPANKLTSILDHFLAEGKWSRVNLNTNELFCLEDQIKKICTSCINFMIRVMVFNAIFNKI